MCVCVCAITFKRTVHINVSLCIEVIAAADIIFVTAHINENIREKSLKNKRGYLV